MSTTVHVHNISRQTGEKEVTDFFSFCGKIQSLSLKPAGDTEDAPQSATVTFEKEPAAKTALLLDNTQLGPAQIHVTAAKSLDELAGKSGTEEAHEEQDIAQEDKPRSRILAEYLAHGYAISDKAIESAIALDQQHGISTKFTNTLKNFDQRFKATEKAHAVDTKYRVSDKAAQGWRGLTSYFDRAMGTPTGQKLRKFYETSNKQVIDVHNEARHLADLKKKSPPEKVEGTDRTKCNCHAETGKCGCAPGTCACESCAKNPDVGAKASAEEMDMHTVEGTDRTKCNCGATAEKCPCQPGKCACANCAKNPEATDTPSTASHSAATEVPSAAAP